MSYDLAVWEGHTPSTNADALAIYRRVLERMQTGTREEPTPAIRAYVDALLARWPDLNDPDGDDSPWSSAPLIDEASGDAIYFGMAWSQAEQASEFAVQVAADHGLVCFDPQSEQCAGPPPDSPRLRTKSGIVPPVPRTWAWCPRRPERAASALVQVTRAETP